MKLVNIEGYSSLKKDTTNGGVVNTNKSAYKNYMKKKSSALAKYNKQEQVNDKVSRLENDINSMRNEVSEIKDILTNLAKKL